MAEGIQEMSKKAKMQLQEEVNLSQNTARPITISSDDSIQSLCEPILDQLLLERGLDPMGETNALGELPELEPRDHLHRLGVDGALTRPPRLERHTWNA